MNKSSVYRPFLDQIQLKIANHELTVHQLYQIMLEKLDEVEQEATLRSEVNGRVQAIRRIKDAGIPRHAKAGCIGEHKFSVEHAQICPECYEQYDENCEICRGESDENGFSDLEVVVPWDLQKQIYKDMTGILIEQLELEIDALKGGKNV